jgi:hypothetical protein
MLLNIICIIIRRTQALAFARTAPGRDRAARCGGCSSHTPRRPREGRRAALNDNSCQQIKHEEGNDCFPIVYRTSVRSSCASAPGLPSLSTDPLLSLYSLMRISNPDMTSQEPILTMSRSNPIPIGYQAHTGPEPQPNAHYLSGAPQTPARGPQRLDPHDGPAQQQRSRLARAHLR